MMKVYEFRSLSLAAILATCVALGACSEPGRAVDSSPEIVTATKRDIRSSVVATGIVRPKVGAEVRVGSRVSGIVSKLHVSVGDRVREGDLLAELEATGLDARMRQAAAARANVEATLELARQNENRLLELHADQIAAESELDLAVGNRKLAEASLEEADANLEAARIERGYSTLRAPISGVVASVSTQEGETVAASFAAPTFVTIIDLDRLEVWAYVDETDIGRIEIGQQASFTVDTYPDFDFLGQVQAIQPAAEVRDNVVNYIARIEISDDLGHTLRPEMTTTVEVLLETRTQVLTVPNGAVRRERGRKYVFEMKNGAPSRVAIQTGWKDQNHTEITEGLAEGAQLLIGDPPGESSEPSPS